MFKTRAFALLATLLLFPVAWVLCQELEPPKAKDEPAKATKPALPKGWLKLGLTDAQKQESYKVRARFGEPIRRLQEQLDALKAEERAELEKILTPEQRKQLRGIIDGEKPKEPAQ